jgi:hypothetical protein
MVKFDDNIRIRYRSDVQPSPRALTSTYSLEGSDGFRATCHGFDEVGNALRQRFIFKNEDLKIARLILDNNPEAQVALSASYIG